MAEVKIRFVHAMCPRCGRDMTEERDAALALVGGEAGPMAVCRLCQSPGEGPGICRGFPWRVLIEYGQPARSAFIEAVPVTLQFKRDDGRGTYAVIHYPGGFAVGSRTPRDAFDAMAEVLGRVYRAMGEPEEGVPDPWGRGWSDALGVVVSVALAEASARPGRSWWQASAQDGGVAAGA